MSLVPLGFQQAQEITSRVVQVQILLLTNLLNKEGTSFNRTSSSSEPAQLVAKGKSIQNENYRQKLGRLPAQFPTIDTKPSQPKHGPLSVVYGTLAKKEFTQAQGLLQSCNKGRIPQAANSIPRLYDTNSRSLVTSFMARKERTTIYVTRLFQVRQAARETWTIHLFLSTYKGIPLWNIYTGRASPFRPRTWQGIDTKQRKSASINRLLTEIDQENRCHEIL